MTTLRALIAALVVIASFGLALAKLPPPDDAAKAAAAAKKEKDAATADKEKAELAAAQDRVVAKYKGKTGMPASAPAEKANGKKK